ncbi:hypothetical protein OJF2_44750 [Aquisphaera giovannonii]|uniref:Uncharacterized protein n=1 Tax=Aquisphaera giovannonii TaxID=406548 RepID=A0A5B9W5N2_9BACT|nr:hypothetical protein [Aquisphaera giovannonii]QEH35918.1 hypothetical protein OJF2_44750 [Aquisphaera giovannonii]
MPAYLRAILAALAGMLAAFALIVAVEAFGAVAHPVPDGFGGSMEEVCRHVEGYPRWVLAAVVPLWGLAALAGTGIARRIGGVYASGAVGLLLLVGLVFNLSKLPYPAWFQVANLLVVPAAIVAGSRSSGRRRPEGMAEVS